MNKIEIFHAQFPGAYFFDDQNLEQLPKYLIEKGLISHDEKVHSITKPGEGNMNFVKRIVTDKKSFIIKQSRPWVEKYPQIEAPIERLHVEARYYQMISQDSFFQDYSPRVILYDTENLIIATEDLGVGSDFTFCYKKAGKIHESYIGSLLKYISQLHNGSWGNQIFPRNQELKKLNHEHIFNYPYMADNGFDLETVQPGLQQLSIPFKNDPDLKEKIAQLGKTYLASGPVLIHGDFYPGSWLLIRGDVKVIDPEFAYFGYPEFDLGVMVAHLLMAGMTLDDVKNLLPQYQQRPDFDNDMFLGFCGAEIIRRIIGLAQLPLDLTLHEKERLMSLAKDLLISPRSHQ